jgi:hypothetical protein
MVAAFFPLLDVLRWGVTVNTHYFSNKKKLKRKKVTSKGSRHASLKALTLPCQWCPCRVYEMFRARLVSMLVETVATKVALVLRKKEISKKRECTM